MSETSAGSDEHPKVVDLMDALERSVAEAKEARKQTEWVPVAVLDLFGMGPPMAFPMDSAADWEQLRVEVLSGWEMPPRGQDPAVTDPDDFCSGFTLEFKVMTRAELEALPEHGGW